MKDQVTFFKQFRVFSTLRVNTVELMSYNMREKKFKRGQTVYEQGKSATNGVYFIKAGEFEILQSQKKNIEIPTGGDNHGGSSQTQGPNHYFRLVKTVDK